MQKKEIRREKRQCSTQETKRKEVEGEANRRGKRTCSLTRSWMREDSGGRKVGMELRRSRRRWAQMEQIKEEQTKGG